MILIKKFFNFCLFKVLASDLKKACQVGMLSKSGVILRLHFTFHLLHNYLICSL